VQVIANGTTKEARKRVHATFEVYESITDKNAILRLRENAGKMLQTIMASGKVVGAGIFPGIRGGNFVLNVDTPEELLELLGDGAEFFRVTRNPVVSPESLGQFFESHPLV
jgi:hypothetical protein